MSSRREALLDAAETVLERDGLEDFGVGALAREAGVKPPSLYKHFSGIAEIEHALISRWFRRLALALGASERACADMDAESRLNAFAASYRAAAAEAPQLYRLATERPLQRGLLEAGVEEQAMGALLRFFGETLEQHDRARLLWAAAHGLVALELAGRYPPGADVDSAWALLARTFAGAEP